MNTEAIRHRHSGFHNAACASRHPLKIVASQDTDGFTPCVGDPSPDLRRFLTQLDQHVAPLHNAQKQASTTAQMLRELLSRDNDLCLDSLPGNPTRYARYRVHTDPRNRYCVVAMRWDPGQAAPVHDHDGAWCVEGLYQGRLRITPYELQRVTANACQFTARPEEFACTGDVGALVPPYEYHKMANDGPIPAITLHVYGHELKQCARFLPDGEGYVRDVVPLRYDGALTSR